jgi:hypothetical protein
MLGNHMPELRSLGSYIRILIAVLAMLDVASPARAGPVVRAAVSNRPRIYVANSHCRGHTYRPENITLACRYYNLFATEVHFFEAPPSYVYGSPEAGASATIHENVCKPSCSSGRFFSDKGALTLTRIVRCEDGLLYYSQADYAFQEGQGKVDIAPPERCSLVRAGA